MNLTCTCDPEGISPCDRHRALRRTKYEQLMWRLLRGSEHRGVCEFDESIRHRCEQCMAAERAESDTHERLRH